MPGWADLSAAAANDPAPTPETLAALARAVSAREAGDVTPELSDFVARWPRAAARHAPDLRLRRFDVPDWRSNIEPAAEKAAPAQPPRLLSVTALEDLAARIGRPPLPALDLRQPAPAAPADNLEDAIARLNLFLDRELTRSNAA
jgi:hypothetical protein